MWHGAAATSRTKERQLFLLHGKLELTTETDDDEVFAYVEKEDTPRPLLFQLDLLRQVGFSQVEMLHKNVCFAAFGAVKG